MVKQINDLKKITTHTFIMYVYDIMVQKNTSFF